MRIHQIIDQLYWTSKFGRPSRKISAEELFANPQIIENPVFFLSTGRCGTEWFTVTLKQAKKVAVFHDPSPNLSVQNKFIHQLIQRQTDQSLINEIGIQLIFAGREQYFRQAYKTRKRYVETNNHITFFAYSLAELFPSAKFIHLYRHPGDFVSSGINRGWFQDNLAATEKIIVPNANNNWKSYTAIEKIGWVWNETNHFIEKFKQAMPERVYSYDFTKRNTEDLVQLFNFLNITKSEKALIKALSVKRNAKKSNQFPSFENWKEVDKKSLRNICGKLCEEYKYEL